MRRETRVWIFRVMMATLLVAGIVVTCHGRRAPGRHDTAARRAAGTWAPPELAAGPAAALAADDPPPAPPRRLSETGLYAADGSIDPANRPFAPQYPLWTDGAAKLRWVFLPPGARIDVSRVDAWQFPAGTKFWKEFAFNGRKVETRMLWQPRAGEWTYATYVWNDAQTDADLAPDAGRPGFVEIQPGHRHSIPGVEDCRTCHEAAPSVVLGFSALQLSDDRDPLAPHADPLRPGMVTLSALVDADRFTPARPGFKTHPPRIRSRNPVERAALGYLSANCGNCHNAVSPLSSLGLVLLHDVAGDSTAEEPGRRTALDQPGGWFVPGVETAVSRLVAPGSPGHSALLYRIKSRSPLSQMPPLGTTLPDTAAIRLVTAWIAGVSAGS